jgi:cell shape-determining protein MreD
MVYIFYLLSGLFLLILQTSVLPLLPYLQNTIDLLVPLVIIVGTSRSLRESLPIILLLGFVVDNLSGSPLFLYTLIYFWLLMGVRLTLQIFQINTHLRLALLVMLGVLLKNVLMTAFFYVYYPDSQMLPARIETTAAQLIWAALLAPVLIVLFERLNAAILKRWPRASAAEAE